MYSLKVWHWEHATKDNSVLLVACYFAQDSILCVGAAQRQRGRYPVSLGGVPRVLVFSAGVVLDRMLYRRLTYFEGLETGHTVYCNVYMESCGFGCVQSLLELTQRQGTCALCKHVQGAFLDHCIQRCGP